MRKLIFGLALGLVTNVGVAEAQVAAAGYGVPAPAPRVHFGSPGQLVISSDANLGLTGQTTGGVDGGSSTSTWTLTLLPSADYFVIQNLSVGAFVDFTHTEFTNTTNGTPNGTGSTSLNTFGLGPRIGYDIPIVDWISVWPKLGLSFSTTSSSTNGQSGNNNRWTLLLYAPFLYHLATHFFVGLGPLLSADLAASGGAKVVTYGLAFTLGGWLQP